VPNAQRKNVCSCSCSERLDAVVAGTGRRYLSEEPSLEEAWLRFLNKEQSSACPCVMEISTLLIG